MSLVVALVRHGAHDRLDHVLCGRMPGVRLGDDGRRQAAAAARRLGAEGLAAVYAGPLERAQETAAPIALAAGVDVLTDAGLNELEFGAWTGARFDRLADDPAWARWNARRMHARPPGGETMLEAQARIAAVLDGLLGRHSGGTVAAVGHADVIKAALAYVLGLPLEFHDRFDVSPGSVSRIVLGAWGMKVLGVNERPAEGPQGGEPA